MWRMLRIRIQQILPLSHRPAQEIDRAPYSESSTVQDMGVDHRCADTPMPEKLLDRPNVVAGREKVCGEAVAKNMRGRGLGNT